MGLDGLVWEQMELRPPPPLRCYGRGPGRPSRCQRSGNSESGWGGEGMFSWCIKRPAPAVNASPSCRLPSPPPKSTRMLEAVNEQPTSPATHAPASARLRLPRPPPGAARLRTADAHVLPHRHAAMGALRFTLLFAVLLGLALLTTADQASADDSHLLCQRDMRMCAERRVRCLECRDNCFRLSELTVSELSARSRHWSRRCSRYVN